MAKSGLLRHFLLVHGGCHGAWCWYKVATLLRSGGHRVTALDMAASGIHPKTLDEVKNSYDYFNPLLEFMADLSADDRVVLVGHSAGGIGLSIAMEMFPHKITVAVFVTAFMPGPNFHLLSILEECYRHCGSYMDSEFRFDRGQKKLPTSILLGPVDLSTKFYQLSAPEDVALATLLMRPIIYYNEAEWKEIGLTTENYGNVSRVYVVADQDKVLTEDFQRWMIENNPVDKVKVIRDSDHMVMFSRPRELCSVLEDIAEEYI